MRRHKRLSPHYAVRLAAAKAEQVVFFGDTRQLPPTVVSGDRELRHELGRSPMERLERSGVEKQTLHVQYRMPPALVEFPSKHFYKACKKLRQRSATGGTARFRVARGGPAACFSRH